MRVPHACSYPVRVQKKCSFDRGAFDCAVPPEQEQRHFITDNSCDPIVALKVEYASDDRGIGMLTLPGTANNQPESPRSHEVRPGSQFRVTWRIKKTVRLMMLGVLHVALTCRRCGTIKSALGLGLGSGDSAGTLSALRSLPLQ